MKGRDLRMDNKICRESNDMFQLTHSHPISKRMSSLTAQSLLWDLLIHLNGLNTSRSCHKVNKVSFVGEGSYLKWWI